MEEKGVGCCVMSDEEERTTEYMIVSCKNIVDRSAYTSHSRSDWLVTG